MVKVQPPRGEGEPPPAENKIGNLDKPESEDLLPSIFRVPPPFRRDFKITAAKRGMSMVDQLCEAYALLKERNVGNESTN
jgi:hypothetical protein